MSKRQIIVISVVAVVVMLLVSMAAMGLLSSAAEETKKVEAKKKIRAVQTELVGYDTLDSKVRATGRIVSSEIVELISEVSGKLLPAAVPLKKGQSFRKGDLLVNIYKEDTEYSLKAQKSRFLNALALILPDMKVDFPQRYVDWKGFLDQIDLDEDLPELPEIKSEKEKIFLASRNILNDYFSIKGQEIRLSKYEIRAPFNGAYTQVNLEVGSVTNMGGRIASMIRTDELEMEVPVESGDARLISIGDKVKAISDDGSRVWYGRVERKSAFVDPQTQSVNVYVTLRPTAGKPLYGGMYLTAEFGDLEFKDVMEIPRSCVYNFNEVFVVVDKKLKLRNINILKTNKDTYLINGLEEGEVLVVEPLVGIGENSEVKLMNN